MKLSALTIRLAAFGFANTVLLSLVLVVMPWAGWREVAPYDTTRFLAFDAQDDSWRPIAEAWTYLQFDHDKPVYDEIFFDRDVKFQYALTSLLPVEALQLFRHDADVTDFRPLDVISWMSVFATALFVALIFLKSLDLYAPEHAPRTMLEGLALGALAGAMTLTFYPIAKAFSLGQIQAWISGLFALLVWLWMTQRRVPAGIVGGVICAIKPQLGLLIVWAVLRRHWSFAASFAATFGLIALVTLALYGIENNVDYLQVLSYISRHGESYYPNQSVNGFLNRLLDNGENAEFIAGSFPPFDPIVYVGTLITSIALVGAALFWRAARIERGAGVVATRGGETIDLLIAGLTFTIASPVAWEHHYGVLAPMFAVLLPTLLARPVLRRWTLPALGLSYMLTSSLFYFTIKVAERPLLTPIQSYLLAGALLALALLYLARDEGGREPPPRGAGVPAAPLAGAPIAAAQAQPANSTAPG
jgi:hypothetical protein